MRSLIRKRFYFCLKKRFHHRWIWIKIMLRPGSFLTWLKNFWLDRLILILSILLGRSLFRDSVLNSGWKATFSLSNPHSLTFEAQSYHHDSWAVTHSVFIIYIHFIQLFKTIWLISGVHPISSDSYDDSYSYDDSLMNVLEFSRIHSNYI